MTRSIYKHIVTFILFISVLGALIHSINLYAQEQRPGNVKKIEIIFAEEWEINDRIDKDLQRLIGSVALKHNDVTMTCDSAYYYKNKNQVKAFSRIHIEQGDTLDLYGDYLFYDGDIGIANIDGNVELIDKQTHLYTPSVKYDVNQRVADYNKGGRIINDKNTLTSIIGIYYASQNLFHFKDSVKIVNPDYVMKADTMDYNTESETAFFTGPTELNGDSLWLYCEKGWYDTKNDITSLWKKPIIDNRQQEIRGDSLYYNGKTGFGESFRNVAIIDTANKIIVNGEYAYYYKQPERFMVTERAMFTQYSGKDSLFMHADTISAVTRTDTTGKPYRLVRAWTACRIFSTDLQSKCDSLAYSFQDSVIRFYREPVIWTGENQLTSDSMAIFTKNRQADRLELYNTAFITGQVDSARYNQIKGRSLTGLFRDNKVYKIDIKGNGESIYYLLDGDLVAGVSQSTCASIEILVDDGKISELFEYQNPEGYIDPPASTVTEPLRLKGFMWLDALRPKKKEDIFKK